MNSLEEQRQLACNLLIEEYNSLRNEIITTLDASRHVLSLSLTAIGVLVGGFPFILDNIVKYRIPTVFLIFPLFFYMLVWVQLRNMYLSRERSFHLRTNIIPKLREHLILLAPYHNYDYLSVMSWEEKRKGVVRRYGLLFIPIAGSEYGIPISGAFLSIMLYLAIMELNSWQAQFLDFHLLIINCWLFIYSLLWGFRLMRRDI